jgi:hypothetical protein
LSRSNAIASSARARFRQGELVSFARSGIAAHWDPSAYRVVVFDSAVEGFFLNHSDFFADVDDLKTIPPGPTGLE